MSMFFESVYSGPNAAFCVTRHFNQNFQTKIKSRGSLGIILRLTLPYIQHMTPPVVNSTSVLHSSISTNGDPSNTTASASILKLSLKAQCKSPLWHGFKIIQYFRHVSFWLRIYPFAKRKLIRSFRSVSSVFYFYYPCYHTGLSRLIQQ